MPAKARPKPRRRGRNHQPHHRSWKTASRRGLGPGGLPAPVAVRSATAAPYAGINTVYLWAIGDAHGYRSRYWMTFRQAEALGGHVRRGARARSRSITRASKKTESDRVTGAEKERSIRFLRHYLVFNADQIDGLPAYFYPDDASPAPIDPSAHQAAIDQLLRS